MHWTRDKITSLLEHGGKNLLAEADAARRELCGDAVHLRAIVEFSNECSRNCAYCGLRRENAALPRYTMPAGDILRVVADGEREGVRTIVLQSGESDVYHDQWLAEVITAIKRRFDVAVTLCVGVRPPDSYRVWRQAGADRCLLKHETANTTLYRNLHPDSLLQQRLATLERLRLLGYQIGTGNIIGLPGQTFRDLASDILLTRRLDVDMAAFGPLIPCLGTPLANTPTVKIEMALRVVAVARLVLGAVHIPATTAFDPVAPDGRERALRSGANVMMANLTPPRYRELYQIYPSHRATNTVVRAKAVLARLGRPLASDYGHSLRQVWEAEAYRKEHDLLGELQVPAEDCHA